MAIKKILLSIATIFFAVIFLSPASGLETKGVKESGLFTGTISGSCFNDVNQNGKKDAGEAGVEGITVSLKRMVFFIFPMDAGAAAANADGSYEITGLQPGLYLVEVQNKSGAECTTKNPVRTWLGFFKNKKTADFGFTVTDVEPEVIATAAIAGVTAPVSGATPTAAIADTTEYTATIAWSPADNPFAASTAYTATITITPKAGYTLTGVAANFFTVAGAEATNAINSGVVTAVFPATASDDATITAGSLAEVSLAGTFDGGASIALSSALTVTVPDASKTLAPLALTTGNEHSVVKYAEIALPEDDEDYADTYESGATTITVADGDIIWLLVTAQDTTTKLYYKITVTVSDPLSDNATLKAASKVKGQAVTSLGTPDDQIDGITDNGTVTITLTQAADTSNAGSFITLFDKTNAGATVKVVKYATGGSTTGFETDTVYANQVITTADFFIVKVTAEDTTTILYYKVVVTVTPGIGDTYKGGKVAYILQSGDLGYVEGETRGLIAATADQSTEIMWALSDYWGTTVPAPGAAGTVIGTGLANTNAICTQNGPTLSSYAAGLCYNLDTGGYSDWYLPSLDELGKLYENRELIGGFAINSYWSSSEYYAGGAWYRFFGNGSPYNNGKSTSFHVRAVRSFPNSDASIEAGTLGGETITTLPKEGEGDIASSAYLRVAVGAGSRTLELTKGNANSVIKWVLIHRNNDVDPLPLPADDAAYTSTYVSGSTNITVAFGDAIWLLVTAEDGTKQYYWIDVVIAT